MLNEKGFTLIELLAMMVILGILMAVTIPNIAGIAEANKKQAYAEDALKFKNTVEYKIRSDERYVKPQSNGECVVVSLAHLVMDESGSTDLESTEYENPPYEGDYLVDSSFVVVWKDFGELKYYVQLIQGIGTYPSYSSYKGIQLINYTELENSKYLETVTSTTDIWGAPDVGSDKIKEDINIFGNIIGSSDNISVVTAKLRCSVGALYYSN